MTVGLEGVIASGMCIGCGACIAADPSLGLVLDEKSQSYRPTHPSGPAAASVCPAIGVDFPWLHQMRFPGVKQGPHGVVASVLLAQSTDRDRNVRASSGGLIKEMLIGLLNRDDVDGVISIVHEGGTDFGARLITDVDEIDALPGSIYHAIPFDGALKILRESAGRFVLVAIPCQLEGIFTYIHRIAPDLADRVHTTVGLLCGWQYTLHALRAICEYKGVGYDEIEHVSYRGGGPVGKLRIKAGNDDVSVSRRVDFSYQVSFDRSFNIPRCHLCINHSNFLADIVVGDAWLPSTVFTATGVSLLICRTHQARALVDELQSAGRIVVAEVGEEEIEESQTRRVVFGDFAYAYQEYLDERSLPHPVMEGPNRAYANLTPIDQVARFHEELRRKRRLQESRSYRRLWWRKLIWELPRLLMRYVEWFLVRILRIKTLRGERREVARGQLRDFS